jgi:LmbE family N-acetylglucosaminyl deacetylase
VRAQESDLALGRLGWGVPSVTRLHVPDGGVTEHADWLAGCLGAQMRSGDLWVAPWSRDGHPDHDACGRAVLGPAAEAGVPVLGYLVWAWHWADPTGTDIPWTTCRRLDLSPRATARKRWAVSAFRSQIRDLGPGADDAAVLPPAVLRRFVRPYEVFVDGDAVAVPER